MKIKNFKIKNYESGYTVIETMIAISVFLVVIISGMGALLNANLLHQKSQDMHSIMDNLSFIMEDLSRNLRTGYTFHCINDGSFANLTTPKSCASGGAIAFENALGDKNSSADQWVYKIESQDGGATFNIYKSVDNAQNFVQLNPSEVVMNSISGFSVVGAEVPPDTAQPFVIIKLVGKITYKDTETPFSIQTSVSQRLPDI